MTRKDKYTQPCRAYKSLNAGNHKRDKNSNNNKSTSATRAEIPKLPMKFTQITNGLWFGI
jgi:hypothetical protein